MASKNSAIKQKQEENICDICGASKKVLLRTITNHDGIIVKELSGFTCQKCLCAEDDYVEKLKYKLNRNPKLRDQLAERFQRIRLKNKADFIAKYGPGVKNEKCEACGQGDSYLCIVEDHFEGHVEMWDEMAGWFCADCITTGIHQTYINKALYKHMLFWEECKNVIEKHEFFKSVAGTPKFTEKEKKNAITNFEQYKKLKVQETEYKKKAERMEKARLAYEGTPVKIEIRTAREGNSCSLCGKIYGKDCKCEENYETSKKRCDLL